MTTQTQRGWTDAAAVSRTQPRKTTGAPTAVAAEEEIRALVGWLPQRDRALLRARFGWDGQGARHGAELRKEFKLTKAQVNDTMQRSVKSLWFAQLIEELPATRALIGENSAARPTRAWEQTNHIPDHETRTRYAHMLMVIAGTPPREAEIVLSEHLGRLRAQERAQEQRRRLVRATRDRARRDLTRLIDHTIWPDNPRQVRDLSGYRTMRKLRPGNAQAGYFLSQKLHRFVQYDSGLEREVLKTLETDGRIIAYREQPFRLKLKIDGGWVRYTPDAIALVLHDDGRTIVQRTIVMELKPRHHLGYLENWLRWHALWDWCCNNGAGMFIGSPRTNILDSTARPTIRLCAASSRKP